MRNILLSGVIAGVLGAAFGSVSAHAEPVTLRVFEWEGYISPFAADFEAYAKTQGVDVKLEFLKDDAGKEKLIADADDIFQVVRASGCEVVTPTNNYFKDSESRLIKALAPLDLSQIPNFNDLVGNLKTATYAEQDGRKYAVPLLGGGYSLAYNADRIKEAPKSWAILLDPAARGRISLTDSQYEANVYVAAILAGTVPAKVYNWDAIDHAKVGEILGRMVANVRAFWDSNPDPALMATDLDYITDYGFGVAFANQKGQHWRFADPVEPTTVWQDNISLTPSALATPEKAKAAYLLLNFMISPEIQARIGELYGVVVPNPKAMDKVAADKRDQFRIGTDAFFKPDLMWQPLDKRTRGGFKSLWDEAKKTKAKDVKP
ncbi:MAG: extracellular solute-binding protein [Rhodospirillaceae bacterium]